MYSDMSKRMSEWSLPNRKFASARASSVFPTPVGPRKMKLPTGRLGFLRPARERRMAREIAEIAAGRINDREIRRAKDSLKGRILLTMESTGARMNRLGRAILNDSEILSVERLEAEIEAVTSEGVAELASLLLAPERLSAAGIGPREDKFREALSRIDLDRKVAA